MRPVSTITDAVRAMVEHIAPVDAEIAPLHAAAGRILAQDILLDRPSPACDVSAMDGYAVNSAPPRARRLRVVATIVPGQPAPALPTGDDVAARIFTGAMIPAGAIAVIPRELVDERGEEIDLGEQVEVRAGMHIRKKGENGAAGCVVGAAGATLGPALIAAAASCGVANVRIRKRVRLAVVVTGDEVLPIDSQPEPWRLRDSNGAALSGMFASVTWIDSIDTRRIGDQREAIAEISRELLNDCDALIYTGGVSAGDFDYVPQVVRDLDAEIIFHKLAIRPGKPALGAVAPGGVPILGLPGNPVSALVTARLLALPAMRARAGAEPVESTPLVEVESDQSGPSSLTWHPLVRVDASGRANLVDSRGSGDWVAAARSDGFVQVPAGASARGLRPYYSWSI